jgi:hypothetical protein
MTCLSRPVVRYSPTGSHTWWCKILLNREIEPAHCGPTTRAHNLCRPRQSACDISGHAVITMDKSKGVRYMICWIRFDSLVHIYSRNMILDTRRQISNCTSESPLAWVPITKAKNPGRSEFDSSYTQHTGGAIQMYLLLKYQRKVYIYRPRECVSMESSFNSPLDGNIRCMLA